MLHIYKCTGADWQCLQATTCFLQIQHCKQLYVQSVISTLQSNWLLTG